MIHFAELTGPAKCGLRPNSKTPMLVVTTVGQKVTCWGCLLYLANRRRDQ